MGTAALMRTTETQPEKFLLALSGPETAEFWLWLRSGVRERKAALLQTRLTPDDARRVRWEEEACGHLAIAFEMSLGDRVSDSYGYQVARSHRLVCGLDPPGVAVFLRYIEDQLRWWDENRAWTGQEEAAVRLEVLGQAKRQFCSLLGVSEDIARRWSEERWLPYDNDVRPGKWGVAEKGYIIEGDYGALERWYLHTLRDTDLQKTLVHRQTLLHKRMHNVGGLLPPDLGSQVGDLPRAQVVTSVRESGGNARWPYAFMAYYASLEYEREAYLEEMREYEREAYLAYLEQTSEYEREAYLEEMREYEREAYPEEMREEADAPNYRWAGTNALMVGRCLEADATDALIVGRFLAAFPEPEPAIRFHRLHATLAADPDAERLASFAAWLFTDGDGGKLEPSADCRRRCIARAWFDFEHFVGDAKRFVLSGGGR